MNADAGKPIVLENSFLKVEVDARDLAAHVTTKSTGETIRMAGGQPDDVLLNSSTGGEWRTFAGTVSDIRRPGSGSLQALMPALGLAVTIRLEDEDVVFEVAPHAIANRVKVRDVLYPRHFLLPRTKDAYATFPFSQGSIIPANFQNLFHHREGYAEAVVEWLGGYTGRTGYCGIAETPHDLYQAVDHRTDQPASVFFHWLGCLGELRYARVARFRFAKNFDYVKQARHYRQYMQQIGWWRSMQDKIAENPNVAKLAGAPIVNIDINSRVERTLTYRLTKFADAASRIEEFRRITGIANALVHVDGWGCWGYDAMHPDVLPPNRDAGGAGGLSQMAQRVKDLGYLFGLHDQYIDYYFHAPQLRPGQQHCARQRQARTNQQLVRRTLRASLLHADSAVREAKLLRGRPAELPAQPQLSLHLGDLQAYGLLPGLLLPGRRRVFQQGSPDDPNREPPDHQRSLPDRS